MRFIVIIAVVTAVASFVATPATAQNKTKEVGEAGDTLSPYLLEPLTVRGRIDDLAGAVSTASVGYVGYRDLRLRPLMREGELLETVPGMILTQHSGGGKSNQMFVRGFNLDHGTDFSTRLEGMPVNIPTHAHGQGYTDLNFIIPELVDHIEYALGNYYAEIGDFGSAGGAHMRLRRTLETPLFSVGLGEDGYQRVVAAASSAAGGKGTLLAGVELKGFDGPWERPEELRKLAGTLRYGWTGETTTVSLLALGYDNRWNASDQIPLRGVQQGVLSRFGQVDGTLGGESARYSVSATVDRSTSAASQRVQGYAVFSDLDLFSNFTYRLENPDAGDQIRQQDEGRLTLGLNATHLQPLVVGGGRHSATLGSQLRWDRSSVALSRTASRALVGLVRKDDVQLWSIGGYGELVSEWVPGLRTTFGLRGDLHGFDLTDQGGARTSDVDGIMSPKASISFTPWRGTEVYLSGGLGFHSNDARTVAAADPGASGNSAPANPLVRSRGAEVGLRATPTQGLRTTLALWSVGLDSELLFVGDAGDTEPTNPSSRIGVTVANFFRFAPDWSADLDVSLTRARFVDVPREAERIPGALENVVAAGLTYAPDADGLFGALRLRRFGSYPLVEDGSARANANALLNLNVGYGLGDARVTASVMNLLNEEHSDIQYYYASRLSGEPAGGVEDLHFHPAEPRQIRLTISWGM